MWSKFVNVYTEIKTSTSTFVLNALCALLM